MDNFDFMQHSQLVNSVQQHTDVAKQLAANSLSKMTKEVQGISDALGSPLLMTSVTKMGSAGLKALGVSENVASKLVGGDLSGAANAAAQGAAQGALKAVLPGAQGALDAALPGAQGALNAALPGATTTVMNPAFSPNALAMNPNVGLTSTPAGTAGTVAPAGTAGASDAAGTVLPPAAPVIPPVAPVAPVAATEEGGELAGAALSEAPVEAGLAATGLGIAIPLVLGLGAILGGAFGVSQSAPSISTPLTTYGSNIG